MRFKIYAEWWQDGRMHQMDLVGPIEIRDLDLIMHYGSVWQNEITIGPLDVSTINSLTLHITKEIN